MVYHTDRTTRRFSSNPRSFRDSCQLTDGCAFGRGHLYVHLPYGFSSIKLLAVTPAGAQFGPVGYECNLLYLACLVALVIGGSGPLSVDDWAWRRIKDRDSKTLA